MNNNIASKSQLSEFLNEKIRLENFLLIGPEGESKGQFDKQAALDFAKSLELDLFWVNHHTRANPVCRVLDFSKYFYQLKKSDGAKNKSLNTKKNSLKEVRFSFRIDNNDVRTKVKKIVSWLEEGLTVKASLFMKGREQQYKQLALERFEKIISGVQENSPFFQVRDQIKLIGRAFSCTLFSSRKK